jgi:tetratricopeptide (TPR) repeat protein
VSLNHQASMIASLLFVQALAAAAPTIGQQADSARLAACVAKADTAPDAAYEDAMAWARETFVHEAFVCAAVADIQRGRVEQGAKRLEGLSVTASNDLDKANLLARAGNAWLSIDDHARALAALDRAFKIVGPQPELLIDRASARIAAGRWREAEEDLNLAIDANPKNAIALAMRGQVRLQLNAVDLALKDADAALALDPKSVFALKLRGDAREAKRTGKAPGG